MLALLAFPVLVAAVSTGRVDVCNAFEPAYGCSLENFVDGERLKCSEPDRYMSWATKPVWSDNYVLSAGYSNNQTEFSPGRKLRIALTVRRYDTQYSGILLYAYNKADKSPDPEKLGSWEFVDTATRFHAHCPGAVVHTSASPKPYLTSWRFLPPAGFTGTLGFIALLKVGGANTGEFYTSNLTLTFRRAPLPALNEKWYRGATNRSCEVTCRAASPLLKCDETRLSSIATADNFEELVEPVLNGTCRLPLLARCTDQGLSTDASGFCYVPGAASCTGAGLTVTPPTCSSAGVGVSGRRLCPCTCITPGPECVELETSTTVTTRTRVARTGAPTPSPTPVPTATRGPGTATLAPKPEPLCSAQIGCVCGANGECPSNATCSSQRFCVVPSCAVGALGCACLADKSCGSSFVCANDVCVRPVEDTCRDGLLGCPCVDGTCVSPSARCFKLDAAATTGVCGLDISACVAGSLGCECKDGACTSGDFVCMSVGTSSAVCVDNRQVITPSGDGGIPPVSASNRVTVSVALFLAVLFAN